MKKLLLLLVILCSCFLTNAQPVLDSVWFSKSKNIPQTLYNAVVNNNQSLREGIIGEKVIWDFSNLKAEQFDSESLYTEIKPGNHKCSFLNNNWINSFDTGDEVLLHLSKNQLNIVGDRFNKFCQNYADGLTIFNFPLTYNSTYKDTASYTFQNDQILCITYRDAICDGYGTLIMPQDTFKNIIRIKYTDKVLYYKAVNDQVLTEIKQIAYYYLPEAFYTELLTIIIEEVKEYNSKIYNYKKKVLFNPALKGDFFQKISDLINN